MYQDGNVTRGSFNEKYWVNKPTKPAKYEKYNYRFDDKRLTTGLTYTGKDNGIKAIIGIIIVKQMGLIEPKTYL